MAEAFLIGFALGALLGWCLAPSTPEKGRDV